MPAHLLHRRQFLIPLLLLLLAGSVGRTASAQTGGQEVPLQQGASRDEMTFSLGDSATTGAGAQYIVIHNFKIIDLEPTGKEDEYALTILAVTPDGEPDQHVVGGILFDIDGQSTVIPFDQGGVGDVVVKAKHGASQITLRAVDSSVTRSVDLPNRRWWLFAAGGLVIILIVVARRLRQRQAAAEEDEVDELA